jgi:hypothetical protein
MRCVALQAEVGDYAARRKDLAAKFDVCARDRTDVIAKAKQYDANSCAPLHPAALVSASTKPPLGLCARSTPRTFDRTCSLSRASVHSRGPVTAKQRCRLRPMGVWPTDVTVWWTQLRLHVATQGTMLQHHTTLL